jgi:hypothetical protein
MFFQQICRDRVKMKTSNEWQFHRRSCEQSHPTKTVNTISMSSYQETFPLFPRSRLSLALGVALGLCASFFRLHQC